MEGQQRRGESVETMTIYTIGREASATASEKKNDNANDKNEGHKKNEESTRLLIVVVVVTTKTFQFTSCGEYVV